MFVVSPGEMARGMGSALAADRVCVLRDSCPAPGWSPLQHPERDFPVLTPEDRRVNHTLWRSFLSLNKRKEKIALLCRITMMKSQYLLLILIVVSIIMAGCCQPGEEICNGFCYNTTTHSCCGNLVYNISNQSCCNGQLYNPNIQECINGTVRNRTVVYLIQPDVQLLDTVYADRDKAYKILGLSENPSCYEIAYWCKIHKGRYSEIVSDSGLGTCQCKDWVAFPL